MCSIPDEVGVVVGDNASGDETVSTVRAARPDAKVIVNERNMGFAAAANQGIGEAGDVRYVLLLNPDASLLAGALGRLVAFAEAHSRAGLVSALVVDERGRPERVAAGRDVTLASVAVHELGIGRLVPSWSWYRAPRTDRSGRYEWVAATSLLVRRAAVEQVGLLDDSYFLYCEDCDWARRMREAGWEVWVEPAARAEHRRSSAVESAGAWVDRYRVGSVDAYFSRRHRGRQLRTFRAVRATGQGARGIVYSVLGALTGRGAVVRRGRQRLRDARSAWTPERADR